jgi:hypothetical protein
MWVALLVACTGKHALDTDTGTPAECFAATYADADGDGYGDPDAPMGCDGPVVDDSDCDDADPAVHPGAPEVCDAVDDDCDGAVDAADADVTGQIEVYPDADGDGYGAGTAVLACPGGGAVVAGDCDDADADVSPDAAEQCDGIDSDCAGDDDALLVTIEGGPTFPTIGAAIAASTAGDVIIVCAGSYSEVVTIDHDLTIRGFDPAVRLEGTGTSIVTVTGGDVVLDGLILEHGGSSSTTGGAIDAADADALDVEGCTLADNVGNRGGALVGPTNGALVVRDSTFTGNSAQLGGAMALSGGVIADCDVYDNAADTVAGIWDVRNDDPVGLLDLTGTTIHDNVATTLGGGLGFGGEVDAIGGTVTFNQALYGGGVYTSDQLGTITGMTVSGNSALGTLVTGGGFYVDSDADLTLVDCAIDGNHADGWGGGLYAADAPIRIQGGAVTRNSATTGGGLSIDGVPDVTIADVDFGTGASDNVATDVYLQAVDTSYASYGAATRATCDATGCH